MRIDKLTPEQSARFAEWADHEYFGLEGGAYCQQQHFSSRRPEDEEEFRKLILKAETCVDYKRPEPT